MKLYCGTCRQMIAWAGYAKAGQEPRHEICGQQWQDARIYDRLTKQLVEKWKATKRNTVTLAQQVLIENPEYATVIKAEHLSEYYEGGFDSYTPRTYKFAGKADTSVGSCIKKTDRKPCGNPNCGYILDPSDEWSKDTGYCSEDCAHEDDLYE